MSTAPLFAEPDERTLPTATTATVRRAVGALVAPVRGALLAATAVLVVATGLTLAGPALLGRIIDVTAAGRGELLTPLALAFVAVVAVGAALTWVGTVRMAAASELVLERLRRELFDDALRIPVATLERAGTGDLVSRVTADVATLTTAARYVLPTVTIALLEILLTVVALALLVPVLLAAVAVAVLPILAGARWYLRRAPVRYRALRQRVGVLLETLHEAAAGARTLLAFGAAGGSRARIQRDADAVYDAEMAATRARNVLRPTVTAGQVLALGTTLLLGAWLAGRDAITVGVVTAAALYQIRLIDPVSAVLELLDEIQVATAALRRVIGVRAAADPPAPPAARAADGSVTLRGVGFAYPGGPTVLEDIDLDVSPGQRVAVVGPSGAGKTTLGKLIAGIHVPDRGQVLLGGAPLAELGDSLPRQVVLITQETHVFRGRIAEDLRLAAPDASDTELEDALDRVGAGSWLRALPDGLHTRVGDAGRRLTPMQAQHLALARLLLRDPPVVVLDEATAALDPTAAGRLERSLDAALRGRTVVAITHRLAVAARAELIVVLERGRIVEYGTHEELRTANGSYASLWRRWEEARR